MTEGTITLTIPIATDEVPIIFSALMVRAILAGQKTQTRRLLEIPPRIGLGDTLWVREAIDLSRDTPRYEADGAPVLIPTPEAQSWIEGYGRRGGRRRYRDRVPTIHMPRWAARIRLFVHNAGFQAVQDITEDDACAEGARFWLEEARAIFPSMVEGITSARAAFSGLWDEIHGEGAWAINPGVHWFQFEVLEPRREDAA